MLNEPSGGIFSTVCWGPKGCWGLTYCGSYDRGEVKVETIHSLEMEECSG
ncbi:3181_t:CDS:2 [Rhizophagus irregularis]|nr:3181_t:CDS:2 [Rhizophagus irregularis]